MTSRSGARGWSDPTDGCWRLRVTLSLWPEQPCTCGQLMRVLTGDRWLRRASESCTASAWLAQRSEGTRCSSRRREPPRRRWQPYEHSAPPAPHKGERSSDRASSTHEPWKQTRQVRGNPPRKANRWDGSPSVVSRTDKPAETESRFGALGGVGGRL